MYDTKLPEKKMWDLALSSAVYANDRMPRSSNEMVSPLERFNLKNQNRLDTNQTIWMSSLYESTTKDWSETSMYWL